MVKALFIDFDGVMHPSPIVRGMHTERLAYATHQQMLDMGLFCWAQILEDELSSSDEEIALVVHSSWRKQPWAAPEVFKRALGPLAHRFWGTTDPNLGRENSILDLCQRADIADYRILDDDISAFSPGARNLIVTNPLVGVSSTDVRTKIRDWILPDASRELDSFSRSRNNAFHVPAA